MKKLYTIIGIIAGFTLGIGATVQAATILFPSGGGTGTSTNPTYGQILVGNAGGTYTLTATSSLGIVTTGTVAIANGGTNATSQTTNGINYFDGTKITSGTALTFNGTTLGTPIFNATQGSGTSTIATGQGFTIGSSQFVLQQGSGNVGIGTTTPQQILSVVGGSIITPTSSNNVVHNYIKTTSSDANASILSIGAISNVNFTGLSFDVAGSSVWLLGRNSGYNAGNFLYLKNANNATPVLTFADTSGNVGIATTTPWGKLSVTNTGTDPSFVVEDTTSPDSSPFVIDASGNVGIGTASPFSKLQVGVPTGASTNRSDFANIYGADAGVGTPSGYNLMLTSTNAAAVGVGSTLAFGGESGQGVTPYPFGSIRGAKDIAGTYAGYLSFHTTDSSSNIGQERMRIVSGGNVGIGETAPGSKLSVSGGGSFGASYDTTAAPTNGLIIEGNVGIGTTSPYSLLSISNSATTAVNTPLFTIASTTGGTSTSTLMTVLASGKVGIGTASPSTPLHVYTTSGTGFQVGDNSNGTIKIGDGTLTKNAGAMWTVGSSGFSAVNGSASVVSFSVNGLNTGMFGTATSLSFSVGGNEKLTVLSTGNVGIGTTTPYAQFSIATPNGATGSLSTLFAIASSTQTGATTTLMTVRASGNVGIGTTSPTSLMQLFSTGTTTTSIDSDSATKGGCIEIKDRSGVGYTYITAEDGVLTASTVSCK